MRATNAQEADAPTCKTSRTDENPIINLTDAPPVPAKGYAQGTFLFEVYQLICELKLLLLDVERQPANKDMQLTILRLLTAMKKSASFFHHEELSLFSGRLAEAFQRTLQRGDMSRKHIEAMLLGADCLTTMLVMDSPQYLNIIKKLDDCITGMNDESALLAD